MISVVIDALFALVVRVHGFSISDWTIYFSVKEGKYMVAIQSNGEKPITLKSGFFPTADAAVQNIMDDLMKKIKERTNEDQTALSKAEDCQGLLISCLQDNQRVGQTNKK